MGLNDRVVHDLALLISLALFVFIFCQMQGLEFSFFWNYILVFLPQFSDMKS